MKKMIIVLLAALSLMGNVKEFEKVEERNKDMYILTMDEEARVEKYRSANPGVNIYGRKDERGHLWIVFDYNENPRTR